MKITIEEYVYWIKQHEESRLSTNDRNKFWKAVQENNS